MQITTLERIFHSIIDLYHTRTEVLMKFRNFRILENKQHTQMKFRDSIHHILVSHLPVIFNI